MDRLKNEVETWMLSDSNNENKIIESNNAWYNNNTRKEYTDKLFSIRKGKKENKFHVKINEIIQLFSFVFIVEHKDSANSKRGYFVAITIGSGMAKCECYDISDVGNDNITHCIGTNSRKENNYFDPHNHHGKEYCNDPNGYKLQK